MADILAEWGPERTRLARQATWVDFPFIAGYAGFLICARMAVWTMTVAGPLDAVENILGLRILAGSLSPETALMALAAGAKFLLIAAALGLITGVWIRLRCS